MLTPVDPEEVTKTAGNGPELMTVAEFLRRYSISRTEFYRQVNGGRIRLTKLDNASRIARAGAMNAGARARTTQFQVF